MGYTSQQFKKDLHALNQMLDAHNKKMNKHSGGKKTRHHTGHKGGSANNNNNSMTGGRIPKEGDRTFRLNTIDGKHIKPEEGGNYVIKAGKGTPLDAARKAFRSRCQASGKSGVCAFVFTIQEKTRGSDKKIYGPYRGKRVKLAKPEHLKFKGREVIREFKYEVELKESK